MAMISHVLRLILSSTASIGASATGIASSASFTSVEATVVADVVIGIASAMEMFCTASTFFSMVTTTGSGLYTSICISVMANAMKGNANK